MNPDIKVVEVGDIMSNSWGYDQTNVDYFEVIKKSGNMVTLQQIRGKTTETGFMCGTSVPVVPTVKKDEAPIRRRLKNGCAKIYSFGGYAKKIVPDANGVWPSNYVSWYA